jgi:protocatechuate 3,4-dioxygenase beta subunit
VTGLVVMADGSPLPAGLTLSAARSQPSPRVSSFGESLGNEIIDDELSPSGELRRAAEATQLPTRERLAELTRAEVESNGRFSMPNVPERWKTFVAVSDDELYADPPVRLELETESVQVRLVRGALVEGRVTDEDGRAISGAEVSGGSQFDPWMAMDSSARMVKLDETETDAEGRYRLTQVPAELPLSMGAKPDDGGLQTERRKLTALQPGERRELDFVLRRGSRIAGVVRTLEGGPLADADVELRRLDLSISDMSGMMDEGGDRDAETDAEGRFAFDGVPDGKYQVVLDEDGYRDTRSGKLDLKSGHEVGDVALVADPGLSVEGRVTDAAGQGLPNAYVSGRRPRSLTNMYSGLDGGHPTHGTADAEGRFRLVGFDPGGVHLEVRLSGYIEAEQEVQAGAVDVTVVMQASVSLSGIVVSTADGEPVAEFRAGLTPSGGLFDPSDPLGMEKRMTGARSSQVFRDRADGTFTLEDLEPGTYDLTVHAEGFGDTTVAGIELGVEGRKGQIVMLPPESVVTGQVVAALSGLPIEGALVAPAKSSPIEQMFEGMLGKGPRSTTDAEGRFRVGGLDSRPLNLHVQHDDFRERTEEAIVLAAGETRDLGRIVLSSGGRVHGRVLDQRGDGVPSVVVLLTNATGTTIKRDSTDPEGRYSIGGLPPGTFNVMRADFTMELSEDSSPMDFLKDLVMQSVTLGEDEEREVDLRVSRGGGTLVRGTVRAAGGPAEGAMVSLMPERGGLDQLGMAMTDKQGDYEIDDIKPGKYMLQVVLLDPAMTAGSQPSSPVIEQLVVAGEPELRHDVRLPGGVLRGRVESALDGQALAGVRVLLQRTDEGRVTTGYYGKMEGRVGETYSTAAGDFEFKCLPTGTYAVLAGGQNLVGMGLSGWARTRVDGVKVVDEGSGFKVRVQMRRAGSIAGRVSNAAGQAIEGAAVWVRGEQDGWISTFSETSSNASGGYEVPDLPPGAWTLAFRADGYGYTLVSGVLVREGAETPQDVTLPEGVALKLSTGDLNPWDLTVELIGPDGPLPTELTALSDLAAAMGGEAQVLVGTFAPGTYQLRVISEGQSILDTQLVLAVGEGSHVVTL